MNKFQSPSLRGSGRFRWRAPHAPQSPRCFNPLHCGAVVASRRARGGKPKPVQHVSIPFIAGQWSLRGKPERAWTTLLGPFQSPSLRGSGRFYAAMRQYYLEQIGVSIPFIAGQWSLPDAPDAPDADGDAFQSPSLRGSGRFSQGEKDGIICDPVSIPFIAGQWSLRC